MTLSSNIGNHAILSSDIYLGVSSMNQMINQNQFLTENSYTKLKNDHDLKVPFTGYAYSNSSHIHLYYIYNNNKQHLGTWLIVIVGSICDQIRFITDVIIIMGDIL